jgi:O-antigen ligase
VSTESAPPAVPGSASPRWALRADRLATNATIALAFALPVSTALANACLAALLAGWLVSGRWRPALAQVVATAPAALAALLLGWLLLTAAWSAASWSEAMAMARKYSDLVLIGLFAWLLREPAARARAIDAFCAAMLLTLALSCAAAAGLSLPSGLVKAIPGNAVVFKMHITHGLLMSLAALIFAHRGLRSEGTRARVFWWCACALASANVLFMIDGRTGYVVLAAFALLAARLRAGWPGVAAALLAVVASAVTAYHGADGLRSRIDLAVSEAREWRADRPVQANDSIGSRLEFWSNSATLVREHPLAGHGLGAFPASYAALTAGSGRQVPHHPHNEFLLLAVQAGLPAAALFAWLLVRLYGAGSASPSGRSSTRALPVEALLASAIALWMALGCAFNSLLIDHTESLLFALVVGLVCAWLHGQSAPAAPEHVSPEVRP